MGSGKEKGKECGPRQRRGCMMMLANIVTTDFQREREKKGEGEGEREGVWTQREKRLMVLAKAVPVVAVCHPANETHTQNARQCIYRMAQRQ